MGSVSDISLEEIIKRKIMYYQSDTKTETIQENKGYIRGYKEILEDLHMEESDFTDKYLKIVSDLDVTFEETDYLGNEELIDELSGYNNAIVDVLRLIDEKYLYPINPDCIYI